MSREVVLSAEERRLLKTVAVACPAARRAEEARTAALLAAFDAEPKIPRALIEEAAGLSHDGLMKFARRHGRTQARGER